MHEEDLAVMKLILFRRNVLLFQLIYTNKTDTEILKRLSV